MSSDYGGPYGRGVRDGGGGGGRGGERGLPEDWESYPLSRLRELYERLCNEAAELRRELRFREKDGGHDDRHQKLWAAWQFRRGERDRVRRRLRRLTNGDLPGPAGSCSWLLAQGFGMATQPDFDPAADKYRDRWQRWLRSCRDHFGV